MLLLRLVATSGADLIIAFSCERCVRTRRNGRCQSGLRRDRCRRRRDSVIDAELALHDTMDGYDEALRSERAYSLWSVGRSPALASG